MGFTEERLLNLVREMGVKTGKLGPGDDCDCIEIAETSLCVNVDGFAAKEVMMDFMDLSDVGWRGVIASLSDLVAKGCVPRGSGYSVYANDIESALQLSRGALEAVSEYSLTFLGADTNRGNESIDAFSLGTCSNPIPIDGAEEGDLVVIPKGCWGCVKACLEGIAGDEERAHCKRPRIPKGLAEALVKYRKFIRASTDSSDSLAVSLWKLAKASNKAIELHVLPSNLDEKYVLYSGEEYLPVLVVDREGLELVKEIDGMVIGRVREGPAKVTLYGREVKPLGWEWF
ncbi:hypothetical protein EYM_01235 [Ignicoccus islandicus DSM 13165]|uniref:PurM-like N-terminal domain-containing protein n=1 Tax=Ignicoccus islandicus DSM 13165 TaxID=940295 RepID=A0A0U3FRT0_9CREN|nr:hypothetical protein EYM_01235 [Ignicoccus islandicus DSM 13165]